MKLGRDKRPGLANCRKTGSERLQRIPLTINFRVRFRADN
jgi:hypothetical protein